MTSAVQSVQVAFTEWLAKLLGNPTFAAQAVGDIPGSLAAEGITEDQLQYLNVQQAVTDACNYPGVPPAAKAALAPPQPAGYAAPPPPPPQNYTEVVQQLQVVNNFVTNEVIDNSTNVTVGDNFSGDLVLDNDVTTVEGNENVVGDNNETANIDIDAGGGDGGTATGGAGGTANATGGTNTNTTNQNQNQDGFGQGAEGGEGEEGGGDPQNLNQNQNQNNQTAQDASADADADGGDAYADGGDGGSVGPITINFGDDQQEAGPGNLNNEVDFFPPTLTAQTQRSADGPSSDDDTGL